MSIAFLNPLLKIIEVLATIGGLAYIINIIRIFTERPWIQISNFVIKKDYKPPPFNTTEDETWNCTNFSWAIYNDKILSRGKELLDVVVKASVYNVNTHTMFFNIEKEKINLIPIKQRIFQYHTEESRIETGEYIATFVILSKDKQIATIKRKFNIPYPRNWDSIML